MFATVPATTPNPTPGFWVHDLSPFIIEFPEGFFLDGIRWYGLAYLAGFVVGAWLLSLYYKRRRSPLDADAQSGFIIALILGVLVGGRLGYMLFYAPEKLWSDPLSLFQVWQGGMASHGGMIGVLVATWWTAHHYHCKFLRLCDIVVTLAPAGLLFGRIANFINGELWGKETDVAWAVIFKYKFLIFNGIEHVAYLFPRHPSQLYEAALEGLLLLVWTQLRFWKKKPLPPGQLAGEAALIYAGVRIFCEVFREPDAGVSFICGMARGQFFSVLLALLGVAFIVFSRVRKDKIDIEEK